MSVSATSAHGIAWRTAARRATAAEWARTWNTRGILVLLPLSAGLALLFTTTAVMSVGHRGGADIATVSGIRKILSAGGLTALIATVSGVLVVTTEFRHRTAAASLLAVGSRRRWALSKLAVACPFGLLVTTIGQAAALGVGVPLLAGKGVHVPLWHGDFLLSTVGTVAIGPIAAAWGVGVGLLVRSQVAAVAGTVVYTALAEGAFLNYVPSVGGFLPGGVTAALTVDPTLPQRLAVSTGLLVGLGWAALLIAAGLRQLLHEDVPAG